MNRIQPLVVLAFLATTGCAGKQLRAEVDGMKSELSACQSGLAMCKADLASANTANALAAKRLAAYRDLAARLRAALGADGIDIIIRNGRLVVQLPNGILFDSGKIDIKPSGQEVLRKLAGVIKTVDRSFLLAGHTDNVPVKADAARFRDNWELSVLRATTAATFLQSAGVPPERLGAAGYGPYMPDASNDTDAGKAENRRLEVIIMPRLDEIPELPAEL